MQLNHTIIQCRNAKTSAEFLAAILGRPKPTRFGPFLVVETDNGVSLDYDELEGDIRAQHYAFLITEAEFDAVFARITQRKVRYWADPMQSIEAQINRNDGGRGMYFADPDGHVMEVITVPYGGWKVRGAGSRSPTVR